MAIDLHHATVESLAAHRACEQDEKYVPPQSSCPAEHAQAGFDLCKARVLVLMANADPELLNRIRELKP